MANIKSVATSGLAKVKSAAKSAVGKIQTHFKGRAARKHKNELRKIQRNTAKAQAKADNLKALQEVEKLKAQNANIKYEPQMKMKKMEYDLKSQYIKDNKDVLMTKYKHQWKNTLAASFGSAANIREIKGDDQENLINQALSHTVGKL